MRFFVVWILLLHTCGSFAFGATTRSFCENVFGPVDCAGTMGNGRLTIALSNTGRIRSVHWPSPGYFDQLSYDVRHDDTGGVYVPENHGLRWAVRTTETVFRNHDDYFVHPERDILVVSLVPQAAQEGSTIYWCANFTPCTRLIPEIPLGDSLFDYANDFAVFTPDNGRTIVHFRPQGLRVSDWDKARALVRQEAALAEWENFDEGVWIAQGASKPPTGFQCGVSRDASSAFAQAKKGRLAGETAAVGDCDSAFQFSWSGSGNAASPLAVYIAFGKTYSQSIENLQYARGKGYVALLRETQAALKTRAASLEAATKPQQELLEVILTCMDRETGALVCMPLAQPPMHIDIPRKGVMGAYALGVAGRHNLVRKRIDFYLNALREEGTPGRPAGSIPAGLYANGAEALPHVILDAEAVAWVLWLCAKHAEQLPSDARATFAKEVASKIEAAADFLETWADPRTGLPRTAFNPDKLRDAPSPELAIHTYMGLQSALALAALSGQERPDWRKRAQELQ
ncbi:MAG: hypothetical protein R6V12_08190, partial [Candidatus Hydrogenedentota bacterium]